MFCSLDELPDGKSSQYLHRSPPLAELKYSQGYFNSYLAVFELDWTTTTFLTGSEDEDSVNDGPAVTLCDGCNDADSDDGPAVTIGDADCTASTSGARSADADSDSVAGCSDGFANNDEIVAHPFASRWRIFLL